MNQVETWMQIGLGPVHIVLDGKPAPPPPKGHSIQFSAHICCGQMAGWSKMPLGRVVGLSPNEIVLDWDPASPPQKRGRAPRPIFGPCLLWPNGWMDQDATWYEGRPRPRRHCVRWEPHGKGHSTSLPLFGRCLLRPCLLWPNGRPFQHLLSSCFNRFSNFCIDPIFKCFQAASPCYVDADHCYRRSSVCVCVSVCLSRL